MTAPGLTVAAEDAGAGTVALRVGGHLDGATARILQEAVDGLDGPRVIFDLGALDYVSSAGLQVFLIAAKRAAKGGGKAVFCNLPEPVGRVFRVSGFHHILALAATRDDALALL